MKSHFLKGGLLNPDDAMRLIRGAQSLLEKEPNILILEDPLVICGDIHGQFYDLMTVFEMGGDAATTQYLFLGDYVDRGCFSTECALYLFALKIRYPSTFWLLRGNHECRHLTMYFNFKEECLHKYNEAVYDAFQYCFDALPLAAMVNGNILCVHGGLSPDVKNVDDINLIDRFREPPTSGAMCDLLWSDPMDHSDEVLCPDALYLHNDLRGCSYIFSYNAVENFLKENQLLGIIRAHEAQDEGFRFLQTSAVSGFPSVTCVFSAPNYCDTYDNKAAIVVLQGKTLQVRQFHSVEHPYILPNFMNAFTWSLPFVFDKLHDVLTILAGAKTQRCLLENRYGVILKKVWAVTKFCGLLRRIRKKAERN